MPQLPGVSMNYHHLSHQGLDPEKLKQLATVESEHMKEYGNFSRRLNETKEGDTMDRYTIFSPARWREELACRPHPQTSNQPAAARLISGRRLRPSLPPQPFDVFPFDWRCFWSWNDNKSPNPAIYRIIMRQKPVQLDNIVVANRKGVFVFEQSKIEVDKWT